MTIAFQSEANIIAILALYVIFTILVSFLRVNALFASKAKSMFFEKFWMEQFRRSRQQSEENFSKNIDFSFWCNCATTQNTFFDIFKWDQNHENHT